MGYNAILYPVVLLFFVKILRFKVFIKNNKKQRNKKMYNFLNDLKDENLQKINDIETQEAIEKNTKIIDNSIKNKELILQNYIDRKNHEASFIKKDLCFNIFLKVFRLYKEKNINLEFNRNMYYKDFIEKNKRQIKDYKFNDDNINNLKTLFNLIKNNK